MNALASGVAPSYLARIDAAALQAEVAEVRFSTEPAADGRTTALFRLGRDAGPKIVLLPPYGMSFLLVARLARRLSSCCDVWIWESRGSPNGDIAAVDADLELATQARDFAAIVERLGIADFHFVGWCQAAQLAVYTAATTAVKPRSMSFIAPAGFGYSLVKSEFERCALPVYLEIARQGVAAAEKLGRILDKYRDAPPTPTLAGDRLTLLHLADPEATYVFSKYMRAYEANKAVVKDLTSGVLDRIPTQTMHCKDDTYSHFSESVQLSKRHPSVQLSLLPRGGHLQLFDEAEAYGDLVLRFIRREEERVAGGVRARAVSC